MSGCLQSDGDSTPNAKPNSDNSQLPASKSGSDASTKTNGNKAQPVERADRPKASDEKIEPLCEGWQKPAIAFALTGQMHGYFEPCGCSEPQYGGVSRRADLIRQLRDDKGWHVTALDLGGTVRSARKQSQLKFEVLANSFKDMKYRALAVGVEELKLGGDWLLSQCVNNPAEGDNFVFMSANVILKDVPEYGPVPFAVVTAGDYKVGITSIFGPELLTEVGNLDQQIQVNKPADALPDVIEKLKAQKCDLLVLLTHGSLSESKSLAKQFPEFKLVVSTGPVEDPLANNPIRIGETTFAVVGHKGKRVGVVGIYPDSKDRPIRMELVRLDGDRFADAPKMVEHMKAYQEVLKQENLVETEPPIAHPSGHKFVGAQKCVTCHPKAFEKWQSTGHAKAFASIEKGRRDIPRIHDPECLSCHVTGWHPQQVFRYDSGYKSEKVSAHLLGNQCENCHGPGSQHVDVFENGGDEDKAKQLMRVTLKQAKDNLCYTCHDLDNSPHFNFDEYWKEIAHPWRD